jgi:hypothetical protein
MQRRQRARMATQRSATSDFLDYFMIFLHKYLLLRVIV